MFKDRLRAAREKTGLKQEDFGKIAGVSLSAQTSYERGLRYPDVYYLEQLADYGIDIHYLVTGYPITAATLSDDEEQILLKYRNGSNFEKRAVKAMIESFNENYEK